MKIGKTLLKWDDLGGTPTILGTTISWWDNLGVGAIGLVDFLGYSWCFVSTFQAYYVKLVRCVRAGFVVVCCYVVIFICLPCVVGKIQLDRIW